MSTQTTRTVTYQEFVAELRAQGVPREHVAVTCIMCETVQSISSFTLAGADDDTAERRFAFSCVGRLSRYPARPEEAKGKGTGCDWSLGGLLSWSDYQIIMKPGETPKPTFPPATPEQARVLMATNLKAAAV